MNQSETRQQCEWCGREIPAKGKACPTASDEEVRALYYASRSDSTCQEQIRQHRPDLL